MKTSLRAIGVELKCGIRSQWDIANSSSLQRELETLLSLNINQQKQHQKPSRKCKCQLTKPNQTKPFIFSVDCWIQTCQVSQIPSFVYCLQNVGVPIWCVNFYCQLSVDCWPSFESKSGRSWIHLNHFMQQASMVDWWIHLLLEIWGSTQFAPTNLKISRLIFASTRVASTCFNVESKLVVKFNKLIKLIKLLATTSSLSSSATRSSSRSKTLLSVSSTPSSWLSM